MKEKGERRSERPHKPGNTPPSRTGQEMSNSEARLRTLFDTMVEGVVLIAPDGQITEANPAAERILELRRPDILVRSYIARDWKILRPDGTPMPAEEMAGPRAMKERRPIKDVVMGVERPDGSVAWLRVNASPLLNAEGRVDGVVGTFADITASRHVEDKHRAIVEGALDGFWINDLEGRLLEVNDSYCRMVGYTREELLNMCIPEIEAMERPEETAEHLKKVAEQGYDRFETRHRCKDGRVIDVEISANHLDVEGGQLYVFVRDITERMRTDEAIRESEARYRVLVESIPQKIFLKDSNSVYISCNSNYADDLGIEPEEIPGRTDYEFYPRELAEKYIADDRRVLESSKTERFEERYTLHGEERVVETFKTPVRDDSGKPVALLGIFQDITERKRTEETLRQREERYRFIADNTSDSIWALGTDLRMTYQSPSTERLFGYTLEEWHTIGWEDYVHPDHLDAVMDLLNSFRRGQREGSAMIPVRVRDRCGNELWAEISASPVRGPDGQFAGVVGVTRDITERKKAEERLLEYKTAVDQSADGIAMSDLAGNIRFVNEAWARMHGYSPEELIGRHLSIFHTKEQMESQVIPFQQSFRQTGSREGEIWHVRRNGEVFPTWMNTTLLKRADGEPLGLFALMRDMTDQKEMERQQRDREVAEARAEELTRSRRRVIDAQESLRKSIAGQLHGTVQNRLILLGHRLAELEARPAAETMAEELADIRLTLEALQNDHIRAISHRLFPSVLRLGVSAGLDSLADEYGAQLPVQLRISKRLRDREQSNRRLVPDNVKLAIYRVTEEALGNILKHRPAAKRVMVKLSLTANRALLLTVSDIDGGQDRTVSSNGIGLALISDYTAAAGGSCKIEAIPDKGTRVTAQVPLAGIDEERR